MVTSVRTDAVPEDATGSVFDDGPHAGAIRRIAVRSARQIDSVRLTYVDDDDAVAGVVVGDHHGGMGGKARDEDLADAEYVVRVSVVGHDDGHKGLRSLRFDTDRGRVLSFETRGPSSRGGGGERRVLVAPPGRVLGGVHGRAGRTVAAIGAHWVPRPTRVRTPVVVASASGAPFDDGPHRGPVRAVRARVGGSTGRIDGVRIAYADGTNGDARGTCRRGGDAGGDRVTTTTLRNDENVVAVSWRAATTSGGEGLEYLAFETDRGRTVDFGAGRDGDDVEPRNDLATFRAPPGYVLGGVHGRADHYLRTIGFYWIPKDPPKTEDLALEIEEDPLVETTAGATTRPTTAKSKNPYPWHIVLLPLACGLFLIALLSPEWSRYSYEAAGAADVDQYCRTWIGLWVHYTSGPEDGCRTGYHAHGLAFFCGLGLRHEDASKVLRDEIEKCARDEQSALVSAAGVVAASLFGVAAFASKIRAYGEEGSADGPRRRLRGLARSAALSVASCSGSVLASLGWTLGVVGSVDDVLVSTTDEPSRLSLCYWLNVAAAVLVALSSILDAAAWRTLRRNAPPDVVSARPLLAADDDDDEV